VDHRRPVGGGRRAVAKGAQQLIPFPFVNMAGVSTSLVAWLLTEAACTTTTRSTSTSSSSSCA
jgi:hypothetical protein